MPGKNTIKSYVAQQHYHIYNRGWNRSSIFLCEEDYFRFEYLVARCLSPVVLKDAKGREYKRLVDTIDLNAYCLMPNHFHMLIFQHTEQGMTQFMQSICTAYTMYFNKKYKRRGPLFENRFKAVDILSDSQLQHITRYIHLNHWGFRTWPHSSYQDYLHPSRKREWLKPEQVLTLFDSSEQYEQFVLEYETQQRANEAEKRTKAILYND